MTLNLKITEPTGNIWVFDLAPGRTYTIGRAKENDIVLNDRRVSRKHAEIRSDGENFIVVDGYIEHAGLKAPPAEDDPAETVAPRLPDPPIRAIDWRATGLGTVIWCTGFTGDFSWLHLPGALDAAGQPIHTDGVGTIPGLYFAGLDFGSTRKSGTVPAIAEEAARLVSRLVEDEVDLPPEARGHPG